MGSDNQQRKCIHSWIPFGGALLCQDCESIKNAECEACGGRLSNIGDNFCKTCAAKDKANKSNRWR